MVRRVRGQALALWRREVLYVSDACHWGEREKIRIKDASTSNTNIHATEDQSV
ncbi:hypothetical protein BDZ89DRAFT_1076899 [Hymenopellis radicata]|nr:hypothetical protein BDZ89DRAFT_1076899 [Hymenopellis radicata]